MVEEWKSIPGYEYHQVSNLGRVRSLDTPIRGSNGTVHHIQKGRIRKPMDNGHGYKWVRLRMGETPHYIHRLVMEVFSPERRQDQVDINHKDGDKSNNRLDNLEWCTRSENMIHAYRTGLRPKGENHPQSKLSFADICEMRRSYYGGESLRSLAKRFKISRQQVGKIIRFERREAC